jgi:plasmid stabilization system protein ParE
MDSNMEVIWSERARITYYKVLDFLQVNWNRHEIIQFINRTEVVIHAIKKNPGIYAYAYKHRNIRRAIVDKHNSFFYQVDKKNNKIYLLTFFDNRQNSKSYKIGL